MATGYPRLETPNECVGYLPVHLGMDVPGSGTWEIPLLDRYTGPTPKRLYAWNNRIWTEETYKESAVHFFLHDWRFEGVWSKPDRAFEKIAPFESVCTPDFSVFRDWPFPVQVYNTFRSRWLGRVWQDLGLNVIPTISWSDERSYSFCFAGIPEDSTVIVSSLGCTKGEKLDTFIDGYLQMLARVKPRLVMVYGKLPLYLHDVSIPDGHNWVEYPTSWDQMRKGVWAEEDPATAPQSLVRPVSV